MIWTNYHGHCKYCDGHGEIEEYIIEAIQNKMPVIGISAHAPVPFDCFWTMKQDDLSKYFSDIEDLKAKYQGKINILTSLEVDYIPGTTGPDFPMIEALNLDYIIGSIHFVDQFENGEPWAIDGSFDEFNVGFNDIFKGDIKKVVKRFFELNREMIQTQQFEIIGHFDKIKMHNATKPLFDESDGWYLQELEDTLNVIAENNIIVEVNTKSFERNGLLFPGVSLFPKMKEKNIDVTINSDAHYPNKQICGFSYVANELFRAGYRYLKEFKDGGWKNVEFDKNGIKW